MITRRSWFVYGTLLAIWVALIGWQTAEHLRVRRSALNNLHRRAEAISHTLALSMRPIRGPGGPNRDRDRLDFASQERVQAWLDELVNQGEVKSIELFNAAGTNLVTAGEPIEFPRGGLTGGDYWDDKSQTLTLISPVTLPTNIMIVGPGDFPTNRPPPRPPPDETAGGPPPGEPPPGTLPPAQDFTNLQSAPVAVATNEMGSTNLAGMNNGPGGPGRRRGGGFRLTPEERQGLIERKGTHGFIMVMNGQAMSSTVHSDLFLRAFIALLASVAVAGYGLAWNTVEKTSELQIRLVRASELNSHLKEMNLAAAGLAHETRNPLNIVRGLAQMISKTENAPPEIRIKSREIIDETDRVAAQLNEFINYSRPREVRRAATRLGAVVAEVARALNYDLIEKKATLQNLAEDVIIAADEQLLRQALFNLVLNATQAVSAGGEILVRTSRQNNDVVIEVADNGHGVAPEHRSEIFKPYFTTHEEGTGLGLAVVQQIVLAHGWEIECIPNNPKGACFRITHVKTMTKS
jgi:signal transduction histidine kinase